MKKRDIPSWDREKVTNTLIEYMTTRAATEPRVYIRRRIAATPIRRTPLRMVSRSERAANRWGNQESTAMLAMTRGPSTNPVWAATSKSAPSEKMVMKAIAFPIGQSAKRPLARTALRVIPSTGLTPSSEEQINRLSAEKARELAMTTMGGVP